MKFQTSYLICSSDILNQQRQWLLLKNKSEIMLDEDIIRRHLYYPDLEEEKLRFV